MPESHDCIAINEAGPPVQGDDSINAAHASEIRVAPEVNQQGRKGGYLPVSTQPLQMSDFWGPPAGHEHRSRAARRATLRRARESSRRLPSSRPPTSPRRNSKIGNMSRPGITPPIFDSAPTVPRGRNLALAAQGQPVAVRVVRGAGPLDAIPSGEMRLDPGTTSRFRTSMTGILFSGLKVILSPCVGRGPGSTKPSIPAVGDPLPFEFPNPGPCTPPREKRLSFPHSPSGWPGRSPKASWKGAKLPGP